MYCNMKRMTTAGRRDTARRIVILIGIFKLLKGCLMILVSVGALAIARSLFNDDFDQWVFRFGIGPRTRTIGEWVTRTVLRLDVKGLTFIAVGAAMYATLFFTEGMGLLLNKPWAEWLTVISTAGLIPVELYEIYVHRHWLPVLTLAANVAIVVYLIFHVKSRMKEARAPGSMPSETQLASAHPGGGSCEPGKSSPRSEASASVLP